MIRLVLFLVALWSLSGLHGVYRDYAAASHVTGQQAQTIMPGRVTVTGTVDSSRVKRDGTTLISLVCQGIPVTVYAGPLVGLVPPVSGASVQVTGKLIKQGLVNLEHTDDITTLHVELGGSKEVLYATLIQDLGLTASGNFHRLRVKTPGGDGTVKVLAPLIIAQQLPDQGMLLGRRTSGGFFIVDRIM